MNLRKNWKTILKKNGKRRNSGKILNKRGQALVEYALLMVVFIIILTTLISYVRKGAQGAFNNFVSTFSQPYTY